MGVSCNRLILIQAPSCAYATRRRLVGTQHPTNRFRREPCDSTPRATALLRNRPAREDHVPVHPRPGGPDPPPPEPEEPPGGVPRYWRSMPYREDLVVAVECMFTWYWLADLCRREGIEFVLGHALYMKAIHGGKAKNDKVDAFKIASLLARREPPEGLRLPARDESHARSASPAAPPRAPPRQPPGPHPEHAPSVQPASVPDAAKVAYKANRDGVQRRPSPSPTPARAWRSTSG